MWKNTFNFIAYPPLNSGYSEEEKRRLNLLYRIHLATLAISLIYIVSSYITNYSQGVNNNIISTFFMLGCILLFRREYYTLSRNIFLIGGGLYLYYLHLTNHTDTGVFYFFFPLAASTMLFFSEKKKLQMSLLMALPTFLLVVCTNESINIIPELHRDRRINEVNYSLSMTISLFMTMYLVHYFYKLYNYSNKKTVENIASLRSLISNLKDPIWQIDRNFRITQFNEAFKTFFFDIYGFEVEIGMHLILMDKQGKNTGEPIPWSLYYKRVLENENLNFSKSIILQKTTYYYDIKFNPIISNGKVTGAVMSATNNTEKKHNEFELKRNPFRVIRRRFNR
ncbi:MAG: PAS domain-containing protein [Bacteroidetes bacterium]|nr:PAS domain-containing protein [Bacteroidota bacterium]